ncbi:carbohydrate porin [Pollutibacter soli]|uniref:carbohydrate porin n=1 Tax=Pollutibacter soli TaxID=3034157 RepID=UPI00301375ED
MRYAFLIFAIILSCGVYAQRDTTLKNRFSIHVQATVIYQYKSGFSAKYSGDNSLITADESHVSVTSTLFAGAKLWKGAVVFINPEIAGGSGLSQVLGVGAAPNGETFRIGDPSPKIYMARLFYQQRFALSINKAWKEPDFNEMGGYYPEKYIALTVGKLSIADFFDDNEFSHDARTQFMSWALMDNGAWDYPADTRGYTPSIVLEYISPSFELRYGFSLEPLTANGRNMNWNITEAGSHSFEYTRRHKINTRNGSIRLLGFLTVANMGNYKRSIELSPVNPDIEQTRVTGRTKFGFGISADQYLADDLGCFLRLSWNDGNNETWTFTEIDRSLSGGLTVTGKRWHRSDDNVGIAYVISGISKPHRNYLMAGGKGFMLGDGNLNYTNEQLMELYYSFALRKKSIYLSGAYQLIINPAYNKDRHGPVNVFSVRFHARI